jgi:hypothetical protein
MIMLYKWCAGAAAQLQQGAAARVGGLRRGRPRWSLAASPSSPVSAPSSAGSVKLCSRSNPMVVGAPCPGITWAWRPPPRRSVTHAPAPSPITAHRTANLGVGGQVVQDAADGGLQLHKAAVHEVGPTNLRPACSTL